MRCTHCDYLLFNLTQPTCPECGRSFDIGWYRFEPAAVSFHCPHCDQAYYGNDAQGLPTPRAFTCVGCNHPIHLNLLRVVPQRPDAVGRRIDETPWDQRRANGTFRAWWATLKMVMVKPTEFFRLQANPSISDAWFFSFISMCVGLAAVGLYQVVFLGLFAGLGMFAAGAAPMPWGFVILPMLGGMVFGALLGPFIYGGIFACTIHMALFFLAPQRREMGRTFRAAIYCMGPYAVCVIPMCGSSIAGVWMLVSLICAVKEVHQTNGWVAALAVLWPVVLLVGCYILLVAALLLGALA